jgi:hypothetical protein
MSVWALNVNKKQRKNNSKKGMIEVQFNWIFVLIAGMVIFLFIISIIMSQKKHADNILNIDLEQKITTTIKGKQQLSNTYSEVSIPTLKLNFDCDNETNNANFRLEDSQSREPLNLEILFASKTLSGDELQIWTKDFSIPFTVTRFMYITNPKQIFIVYNTTPVDTTINSYAARIYNDLSSNLSKKYASSASDLATKLSGYKNYKIICFNNVCPLPATYSFINITPSSSGLYTYGNVTFHKAPNKNSNIMYITEAGLFGAIFSDDAEYYDCQMKRALQQFEIKRSLHYQRVLIMLPDVAANNSFCEKVLTLPIDTLNNMKGYKLNDSKYLYDGIIKLTVNNKELGINGCPQIY